MEKFCTFPNNYWGSLSWQLGTWILLCSWGIVFHQVEIIHVVRKIIAWVVIE